jgi:hypothetical protein
MAKLAERWQRFSETHYARYVKWWFSLKVNLVVAIFATLGLAIFYFTHN